MHKSRVSKAAIAERGFVYIAHPPYNPDLAFRDYFLFPNLKKLGGDNLETMKNL